VETLVVAANPPAGPWQPDPTEVDQVIEMPIDALAGIVPAIGNPVSVERTQNVGFAVQITHRTSKRIVREASGSDDDFYRFGYPEICFVDSQGDPRALWGATAMLLAEFAGIWNRTT